MKSKRNHSINSKKVVSAVLVSMVALSSGTAAFAAEATSLVSNQSVTSSSIFSDVKSGFFAEKHIYKLAAQGILLGDKGLFRPNDGVTQQEAVTMAIRFMNIQNQMNSGAAVTWPTNFTVGNYFKPYVTLAFQKKLLDTKHVSDDAKAKTTWGEKKANREWIAELLVRAIGKEAEANLSANKATSFADNSKISASKLGYVNAAIEMGLTKGIEGNRFDPLGSVTRAQLATFFSRGEAFMDTQYASATEGIVTALSDKSISLFANGSVRNYSLNNATSYYTSTSDTKIALTDVKLYSKVMVIENSSKAVYVEVTDPKEQLENIETTFERLFPGNSLGVSNNTAFASYTYDSNTLFQDVNGNKIEPKDLTAGSQIIIKRENFTANKSIVMVQVKTGVVNKNETGTLEKVEINSKSVSIKNTLGTTESYKWDDRLIVRYQNEILTPAELQNGSTIKYTVQNNIIQSIEVTQAVERTLRGSIYEVGPNGTTLTYKRDGGSLDVKLLSDKPEIVIKGIDKPVISDLIGDKTAGDQVELTLDSKELVTKIVVLNRQMEQKPASTVVSYDAKTKLLTVLDANKKPFVVTLDDKTNLIYNSNTPTLAGMESLLTSTRKVNLSYISNRALSLEVVYKYDGTVTAVDTVNKKITVQANGEQSITVPYSNPTIEMYGKSNLNISDVKVGSSVSLVLSNNQDSIQKIQLNSVIQFEIVSVDLAANRIIVKSEGVTSQMYLDKTVIIGDSGQSLRISDLQVGNILNVTLSGNTATTVQNIKLLTGQVLAVDTKTASVTVKDYNGSTEVLKANSAVKVVRAGSINTNLSSLAPQDRVEIRKDVDGTTIIKVLSSVNREFWKYESSTREFFVKRQYTSENNRYILSPNVYIHQGDTTLLVQSLKENDNIVVYINNDVIVEVQKP
ncbi:S-layer homology domain-containing protein [Paenibacillus glacialis]|uniref:S-layer protein n=1 Tax=Paenibacillus glacialis TaxID=494026 RepID=A0A168M887_9BACL|nr:S-layer homology domain-containing protein [Paenibacillus glacialis]OAB44354.1 S-layer protein [Paenibacillus glacialis]